VSHSYWHRGELHGGWSLNSPLYLREYYLHQAFIYEGFAQHFLHDSFSSGHIGSKPGTCVSIWPVPFICEPGKDWTKHRHDLYNQIGLNVRIFDPPAEFLKDSLASNLRSSVIKGWTAFGDDHLLTRESAFHRLVVLEVAKESLQELSDALYNVSNCILCTKTFFPEIASDRLRKSRSDDENDPLPDDEKPFRPDDKIKSPMFTLHHSTATKYEDPNVPSLPYEGWKFLISYGKATQVERNGGFFGDTSNSQSEWATTFDVGYVRATTPWWVPNYIGAGYLTAPGLGLSSIYPLSFGYWGNPMTLVNHFRPESRTDPSSYPILIGLRSNWGLQVLEGNTAINSTSARIVRGQMSLVADMVLMVYDPLAFYMRSELFNFDLTGGEFNSQYSNKGTGVFTIGAVWNFSGIGK